ncbi:hypothetical protein [Amycolatopsis sp. NBC_01480]|nr:hypothetical protein [Amycolatopsis sp. NBC_01480]
MTWLLFAALLLLVGGLGPALWLAARGRPRNGSWVCSRPAR